MTNIAVVEKGWIGGGNTGRNTTIIRSNYLWDASAGLYDHALKLWEGLSQEINYNVKVNTNDATKNLNGLQSSMEGVIGEGGKIEGVAQTLNWQGNTIPTGTASRMDREISIGPSDY